MVVVQLSAGVPQPNNRLHLPSKRHFNSFRRVVNFRHIVHIENIDVVLLPNGNGLLGGLVVDIAVSTFLAQDNDVPFVGDLGRRSLGLLNFRNSLKIQSANTFASSELNTFFAVVHQALTTCCSVTRAVLGGLM